MYANLLFYRFYADFMTLPVLMQRSNVNSGLKTSAINLMSVWDVFIFADVIIIAYLAFVRRFPRPVFRFKGKMMVVLMMIITFSVNLYIAYQLRPELLTRSFDRQIMVRSIGMFNYHIYDIVTTLRYKSKKNSAKTSDYDKISTYFNERNPKEVTGPLFGAAKGRNVFLISLESLQAFVIDRSYKGQELTPFLNSLKRDPSTFYFTHFYHQTGQGKTSDAEFMMDNSLHPLPSGAVYFTSAQNKFLSTPSILKQSGYYAAAFHANDGSFWNRKMMYSNLGYDKFFDKQYYKVTAENSVGWGLKDIEFFQQSLPLIQSLKQPFYAKFITLTNHYPFEFKNSTPTPPVASKKPSIAGTKQFNDKAKVSPSPSPLPELQANEPDFKGIVTDYFKTVSYLDGALKVFFDEMKAAGLYDNSIFIMYGDHYALSPNHYTKLGEYLGYTIGPFEHLQLQRTPLFIVAPGLKGRQIDDVVGQVDVQPTILHLLGMKHTYPYYFGRDLLAPHNPNEMVVMRDGSFVTNNVAYSNDTNGCYSMKNGEQVADPTVCTAIIPAAKKELSISDSVIFKDLFRFIGKK
jgi:uncharacterized sulfatase